MVNKPISMYQRDHVTLKVLEVYILYVHSAYLS